MTAQNIPLYAIWQNGPQVKCNRVKKVHINDGAITVHTYTGNDFLITDPNQMYISVNF